VFGRVDGELSDTQSGASMLNGSLWGAATVENKEVPRMSQSPAGWYPDDHDPSLERYWTGIVWLDRTRPASKDSELDGHTAVRPAPIPSVAPLPTGTPPPQEGIPTQSTSATPGTPIVKPSSPRARIMLVVGAAAAAALLLVVLLVTLQPAPADHERALSAHTSTSTPTPSEPSLSSDDAAYLMDVRSRLEVDPDLEDIEMDYLGTSELIAVGQQICADAESGDYDAASKELGTDHDGGTVWMSLDPYKTIIPAALETYCPDSESAFNKWANTPASPPVVVSDTATITISGTNVSQASTITYSIGLAGDITQANSATLPWKTTFKVPHDDVADSHALVSAQADSGSTETRISCTIAIAGKTVVTNTSTGPYAVVNCTL